MSDKTYQVERSFQLNPGAIMPGFDALRRPQTYRNLLYLAAAFPLGLAYFIFLVTGVSLGVGLFITLIGIPILLAVFLASGQVARFERWLASTLLDATFDLPPRKKIDGNLWDRLKNELTDVENWKAIVYMLLRFPLGIATFVALSISGAMTVGLITAPLTYAEADIQLFFWTVNTFGEALVAAVLGFFLLPVALYLLNGIASLWQALAEAMLAPARTDKPKREMLDDAA